MQTNFPNDIAAEREELDERPELEEDMVYADYRLQIRRDQAMAKEIEDENG